MGAHDHSSENALYGAIGYYSNFLSQQLQLDRNNSEQCPERFTLDFQHSGDRYRLVRKPIY